MCTSIVEITGAQGAGRNKDGWFPLTHSVVAYDHPQHALHAALARVIEAAEVEEGMRAGYAGPAHPHSSTRALVAA